MTSRIRSVLGPAAVFAAVLVLFVLGLHAIAHAADPTPQPATPPSTVLSWQVWVGVGLGALAGIRVIVDALLTFFKVEAPLTKSTIDDAIRDDLQLAHDKLDKLATSVNGLVDATKPPGGIRMIPGSGTAALLLIMLLGAAGAGALTACSQTSPLHPVVDCTVADQAQVQALIAELSPLLIGQSPDWTKIEKDAIAAGETIGGCALASVIQAYLAPKAGLAAPDPLTGQLAHAVLEDFRARFAGGATFRTRVGDL